MRAITSPGFLTNKPAKRRRTGRERGAARVQGEQAVAEGMLRQVHVHRELLVGSGAKGNDGCRLFWGRPKKVGGRRSKRRSHLELVKLAAGRSCL